MNLEEKKKKKKKKGRKEKEGRDFVLYAFHQRYYGNAG